MIYSKIVVVVVVSLLAGTFLQVECGHLAPAIAPVVPAVRYTHVAPPNIAPFAAQVSTFTKGLNIYAAPFAAGVAGPAIVPRALPAPIYPAPAPLYPAAPVLAPFYPPAAPLHPVAAPLHPVSAPLHPVSAPLYPAPAPFYPAAHAPLVPAPFARSVYAVAPGFAPHVAPLAPAVPALAPALPSTTLLG